jgi:two-component system response regulator EvgA
MSHTCLIIEDCDFVREIYHLNLKNSEVQIIGEAKDGKEGLAKIKSLQPDIIILDLVLPEINGFDVLSQAHVLSPRSKVMVVSTMSDGAYKKKARNLGAFSYLDKPFTKHELLSAISDITQHYDGVQNG